MTVSTSFELRWDLTVPSGDLAQHREFLSCNGGIYLWIFNGSPSRVCYVGEAQVFKSRIYKHRANFRGGFYTSFHLGPHEDWVIFAAEHLGGRLREEINQNRKIRIPTVSKPTLADSSEAERELSLAYWSQLKLAFATIHPKPSKSVRKEIESALILALRRNYAAKSKGEFSVTVGGRKEEFLLGKVEVPFPSRFNLEHCGAAIEQLPSEFRELKVVGGV